MQRCWFLPRERTRRGIVAVAGAVCLALAASCSAPPSASPVPTPDDHSPPPATPDTSTDASDDTNEVPQEPASDFTAVITDIRTAISATLGDAWTTQIIDESSPDEACEDRPHVSIVVPAEGSGAVRSVGEGSQAVVSVVARRYSSASEATEALEYVAITNTTDCNPLPVAEGFEDFFVAESVDDVQLELVDEAEAWASYRRSTADPADVRVAGYSAIYRVGSSLATVHGRVEIAPGEDPDAAIERARELHSTVVASIVNVLEDHA